MTERSDLYGGNRTQGTGSLGYRIVVIATFDSGSRIDDSSWHSSKAVCSTDISIKYSIQLSLHLILLNISSTTVTHLSTQSIMLCYALTLLTAVVALARPVPAPGLDAEPTLTTANFGTSPKVLRGYADLQPKALEELAGPRLRNLTIRSEAGVGE